MSLTNPDQSLGPLPRTVWLLRVERARRLSSREL